MILTRETQQAWVNAYAQEKHTIDERLGFVDGINKAVQYISQNLKPKLDENQILIQCQQAWPKYQNEKFPKFIFDSGWWYAHELENTAGNGSTILEALYRHVILIATYDIDIMGDANRWKPVLEILAPYVNDPIDLEYLTPEPEQEFYEGQSIMAGDTPDNLYQYGYYLGKEGDEFIVSVKEKDVRFKFIKAA
jgi:hypothetical protein